MSALTLSCNEKYNCTAISGIFNQQTNWVAVHFGMYPPFHLRPVLVIEFCGCLHLSVCPSTCVSIRSLSARQLINLGSPNLDRRCKTSWLKSLLFVGLSTLTFKVNFNLKVKFYQSLSLSAWSLTTYSVRSVKFGPKCTLTLLISRLILGLIKLDLQFHF